MMPIDYEVPDAKKLRVIVDTDAACEADDPFAIAHALLCRKFLVRAVLAEHFAAPGSARRSYDEIRTVLDAMSLDLPVFPGEEGPLAATAEKGISEAASFIVEEALREGERPLFVLCLGALTNLARALGACPSIAGRMTVVWIGGRGYDAEAQAVREFNAGNDVQAANAVLGSGADIWQIPNDVYGSMRIGIAEIRRRISPCGRIGRHLYENLIRYNASPGAGWTAGESWTLGDSPAVGVALDPDCGRHYRREAPIVLPDTSYAFEPGRPAIRVYRSVDPRFVIEDFISKLSLAYGPGR